MKNPRKKKNKQRRRKKYKSRNRHHLSNKCKGYGNVLPNGGDNILLYKRTRHIRLHQIFGNMSWEEIHDLLNEIFGVGDPVLVVKTMRRVSRAKHRI